MSQLISFLADHQRLSIYKRELVKRAMLALVNEQNDQYRKRTPLHKRLSPDRFWFEIGALGLILVLGSLWLHGSVVDQGALHHVLSVLVPLGVFAILVALSRLVIDFERMCGPIHVKVFRLDDGDFGSHTKSKEKLPPDIYQSAKEFLDQFPDGCVRVGFLHGEDGMMQTISLRLLLGNEEALCWIDPVIVKIYM